jgi:twitching motility protein PilT
MTAALAPGSRHPGAGARPIGGTVGSQLAAAVALGASDLHLTAGQVAVVRMGGELFPLEAAPTTDEELAALVSAVAGDEAAATALSGGELDGPLEHDGHRFRANVFLSGGRVAAAVRVIPDEVPTMADLDLPPVLRRWPSERRGLLLCCGPTGSGKSTTLAAVIRQVAEERACHIVTLEDPVEHLHRGGVALVHQRSIGEDTPSFSSALRAALREDPDVILVGEMRDPETIRLALTAAETGHLVLSTVHASDAVGVVNRLIDVFPGNEQPHVRTMLSATLLAVSCQSLVRDPTAPLRRHLVAEVLVATSAVRAAIREGRSTAIAHAVETGSADGMQSFDRAFAIAVAAGKVSRADAEALTTDRAAMLRALRELLR